MARRLGIMDEAQEADERRARAAEVKPRRQTVGLLRREVPVLAASDGTLRADDDGKPASAKSVQSYIARAFSDRLPDVRGGDGDRGGIAATRGTQQRRLPAV
jgi:hypothetical protein